MGGGANSDLWSQIHADVTGRTIRQIADPVLANVRGAGLLTLLALGHITRRRHPRHGGGQGHLRARSRRRPPSTADLLKEFVNLYKRTKGIHKRLNGRRLHHDAPAD